MSNLRFAAAELDAAGIRLVTEPINTIDIPDFFLTGTAQARSIIDDVGSANLGVQYDVYHMQIMEGDLARTIEANLEAIWHIQLADNPGRNEPGHGRDQTIRTCSTTWTRSAIRDGSAASTARGPKRSPVSAGPRGISDSVPARPISGRFSSLRSPRVRIFV